MNSKKPTNFIFVIVIVAIILSAFLWFNQVVMGANSKVNGQYLVEVKPGDNLASIGQKLAEDNVINVNWSLPVIAQFKEKWTLYPSQYRITVPANPDQILQQLESQAKEIGEKNKSTAQKINVKILFKEGDTVDDVIQKLVKNNVAKENELIKTAQSPDIFEKDFNFLPPRLNCEYGNLQNCAKYYLEGYLYPDTYEFAVPITPKEIYTKFLKNFDKKVWQNISKKPNSKDFAKIVNMASVIERETGRPIQGVNDTNRADFLQEKSIMAGVFQNRIDNKMRWQSDPTVTYGTGKSLCQQTLKSQADCLYLDSPQVETKYNTYNNLGYPIAPTTSPTFDSINATMNPQESDYLFFVSDASGKKYFAKTNEQHNLNISKVEQINKKYSK
jgi:UPF0755 protein